MILSFKGKETGKIWNQEISKRYPIDVQKVALRKLIMIHRAVSINDLRIPPSNHLKKLKGDRKDQYSIRINEQLRICFYWKESNAYEVEIIDYH